MEVVKQVACIANVVVRASGRGYIRFRLCWMTGMFASLVSYLFDIFWKTCCVSFKSRIVYLDCLEQVTEFVSYKPILTFQRLAGSAAYDLKVVCKLSCKRDLKCEVFKFQHVGDVE